MVVAPRVASDGRGRQGQYDQACHVWSESAGLPGVLLQAALIRGTRSRLPVALRQMPARTRSHWHFQSIVLRGGARGARTPGNPGKAETSRALCRQENLG